MYSYIWAGSGRKYSLGGFAGHASRKIFNLGSLKMQYVYLGVIRICLIAVESRQFLMIVQFEEESSKFN